MTFIALRSLHRSREPSPVDAGETRYDSETAHGRYVDEDEETGLRYMNPSLIVPLEEMWVGKKKPENGSTRDDSQEGDDNV